jgi:hypothetical protein
MLPANPVILRTYAQRLILSPVAFYMTNEAGDATCDLPQRRPPKTTVCPPRFPPIALPLSAPRAHWFRGLLAPINPKQSTHASHLTHTATEHSPQLSSYTPVTSLHTVPPTSVATMSTVTRAYLDQRLAVAKRCSRGNHPQSFSRPMHALLAIPQN